MRKLMTAFVACIACTGADGRGTVSTETPEPARPAIAVDPAQRAEIERDLAVVLTHGGPRLVEAGASWALEATLVNRGTRERWLVRPNDGSGEGWREPHVFYTAEMETAPGEWHPVPPRDDLIRCGNYATDWYGDATSLAPGGSMKLEWIAAPARTLDFRASGRIRLFAHYEYDGGQKRSFREMASAPRAAPPQLDGLGPFAVVSAPLELDVHVDTSIELSLTLRRRAIRVGEGVSFASVADMTVENVSSVPVDVTSGPLATESISLEIAHNDDDWRALPSSFEAPATLAPHARAAVHVAPDSIMARDVPGPVRMRLRYDSAYALPDGTSAERRAQSPWVDLDVVP